MAERMAQLTPTLKVPVKLQVKVSELQMKTKLQISVTNEWKSWRHRAICDLKTMYKIYVCSFVVIYVHAATTVKSRTF